MTNLKQIKLSLILLLIYFCINYLFNGTYIFASSANSSIITLSNGKSFGISYINEEQKQFRLTFYNSKYKPGVSIIKIDTTEGITGLDECSNNTNSTNKRRCVQEKVYSAGSVGGKTNITSNSIVPISCNNSIAPITSENGTVTILIDGKTKKTVPVNIAKEILYNQANGILASKSYQIPGGIIDNDSRITLPPPPPPPPPPSCSYIASYTDSWSNCVISSNWTTAGTITCTQTNSPSPNYVTLGSYSCPGDAPYPSTTDTKTISLNLSSPSNTCNVFADNIDSCTITANISGSTNDNKPISGLSGKDIKSISNLSQEKANRIDNIAFNSTTNNALNFNSVSSSAVTGNGTSFNFTISGIKARSPFVSSSGRIQFDIEGLNGYTTMSLGNIFYNFKKPYRANLVTVDGTNLKIGTEDNVKINIAKGKTSYSFATNTTNIKETLVADSSNFNIQNKKDPLSTNTLSPTIKFQLNYIGSGPITGAGIKVNPNISYSIDGNNVKYVLTDDFVGNNTNELVLGGAKITGVKIIGLSQAYGKQSITNTANVNFSNIGAIDLKTAIKKNVAVFDKAAKEGVNSSNGHKYYYKKVNSTNVNLSSLNLSSDIETLVIRNGNLVIDENINGKLGIIVTKDDLSNDNIGNVFVKPTVKLIKSFIYADGGFISLDSTNSGISGYQDSYERSINLSNQLVMIGSLFSKNTIGGAILGSTGKYSLPGGQTTTLNDKAIMYDLNYIRRGNAGWDSGPLNTLNKGNTDPFIIIYDNSFQSNPPVGFR